MAKDGNKIMELKQDDIAEMYHAGTRLYYRVRVLSRIGWRPSPEPPEVTGEPAPSPGVWPFQKWTPPTDSPESLTLAPEPFKSGGGGDFGGGGASGSFDAPPTPSPAPDPSPSPSPAPDPSPSPSPSSSDW